MKFSFDSLNFRERRILDYLSKGMSTKEIANEMILHVTTVNSERAKIRKYFSHSNMVETIAEWQRYKALKSIQAEFENRKRSMASGEYFEGWCRAYNEAIETLKQETK